MVAASAGGAANRNHQSLQKNLSRRVSFNESTLSKSRAPFGGDLEGQGEHRHCNSHFNLCCAITSLVLGVFIVITLLVGGIYFAFLQSNLPHFHVQRVEVLKLMVNTTNDDTFLTSDITIYLNASNGNGKIELVYSSTQAHISSDGVDLGSMQMKNFNHKASTTVELKVRTSVTNMPIDEADAQELMDRSKVHQLLMDVFLKGHVDFLLNGKKMNGFPYTITCKGIFQSFIDDGHTFSCDVKMTPIS